jgi:single-strand DNA-binding protein
MTVNKCILVGNLGRDAEIRNTGGGTTIANLRLATTTYRRDGTDGEWQDITEWHSVVAFGKTAEIMEKWGKKGKMLYIEGRLQTREYTDKDGNKRWSTEVVANEIRMLGGTKGDEAPATGRQDAQDRGGTSGRGSAGGNTSRGSTTRQEPQGGGYPDDDDNLPF